MKNISSKSHASPILFLYLPPPMYAQCWQKYINSELGSVHNSANFDPPPCRLFLLSKVYVIMIFWLFLSMYYNIMLLFFSVEDESFHWGRQKIYEDYGYNSGAFFWIDTGHECVWGVRAVAMEVWGMIFNVIKAPRIILL